MMIDYLRYKVTLYFCRQMKKENATWYKMTLYVEREVESNKDDLIYTFWECKFYEYP